MAAILPSLDLVVSKLVTVVTTVGTSSSLSAKTTLGDVAPVETVIATGSNITSGVFSDGDVVNSVATLASTNNFKSKAVFSLDRTDLTNVDPTVITSINFNANNPTIFNNQAQFVYYPPVFNATSFATQIYTTPGSYTFTVPANVTSISMLAIGGGGGGAQSASGGSGGNGASTIYLNSYSVTPGTTLIVNVGAGGTSNFGNYGNSGFDSNVSLSGNIIPIINALGGGGGNLLYWNTNTVSYVFRNITQTLGNITATSPSGQAITYSLSGQIPTGFTANATTGLISYTAQASVASVTIANVVLQASTTTQSITKQLKLILDNTAGEATYTTAGTYSWTAPAGVTSVCVVCVGGGGGGGFRSGQTAGGGGGGGLGWKNNITVVPGQNYTVVVGAAGACSNTGGTGGASYFISQATVAGLGGTGQAGGSGAAGPGGGYVGDGGGNGGQGNGLGSGAGGAGGYAGNGGNSNTAAGAGGGGGGGANGAPASGGGGVGIYGQGASGGISTGGSGGTNGSTSVGGTYGGGGPGDTIGLLAGGGAVRIIWGTGRAFPSTLTSTVF